VTTGDPPPAAPATFAPFRYPAFRAIWLANLFSNIGSVIQSVAAAWLMTELTSSHLLIALVQSSATIPILLFGVVAGAIADNYDRRRVMIAAQAGMLVISTALALMAYAEALVPASLLALTFAVGTGTALNGPAWQASVRQQVGAPDLPQAISLNAVSFNLARSVGPAIGGVLLSLWGAALAFATNAVSYLAMIVVLTRWRPEATAPRRESIVTAIGHGFAFCRGSDPLRKVLIRGFAFGFGAVGYLALIPSIARDQLGGNEIEFGALLAAFGLGSVLGALAVARLRRRWGSEAVMAVCTLVCALAQLGLSLAAGLGLALSLTFAAGAGWVMAMTTLNLAMQLRAPDAILGRCLSIHQAVTFGAMALGASCWGTIADLAGLAWAIRLSALWLLASLAILHRLAPMPAREDGRVLPP
jgi:MFS family permease